MRKAIASRPCNHHRPVLALVPVLHHRQSVLGPRKLAGSRPSIESNDPMGDQLWVLDEAHEGSNLPSTTIGRVPSKKDTQNSLRINTYSKTDLHDRYMSSEEEPSPSPDSDTESNEELGHKVPDKVVEATTEPVTADEYEAEIAIAVPILAMRPKLVNITNLAPMHKRKRTEKSAHSRSAVKNAALRMPTITDENKPFVALEATKVATSEERLSKRKDSLRSLAPDSWLPDDGVHIVQGEEDEEDEHYFPDLELRKAPTYDDYDPYSLCPPRLSPRNSYNSTSKKPGSVARARNNSNPPITMNSGWKGLTRSMSLARKQTNHRVDHQVSKKPKMIARAANEREESLIIPAFPFGPGKTVG